MQKKLDCIFYSYFFGTSLVLYENIWDSGTDWGLIFGTGEQATQKSYLKFVYENCIS